MRGQVGLEYLILVGLLLAMLIPIYTYQSEISIQNVRITQSKQSVERIASAADRLHHQGGGRTKVEVSIPSGVINSTIENSTIKLTLKFDEGYGEALAFTEANITGSLPVTEGRREIPVWMDDDGRIHIGDEPEGSDGIELILTVV